VKPISTVGRPVCCSQRRAMCDVGVRLSGILAGAQADMVLSSIGYRSVPLEGAPFDARRGVLVNRRARAPRAAGAAAAPAPPPGCARPS